MWNILEYFFCIKCFVFFCHVLHNFPFYGGKTGHSNGKLCGKSPFRRTSSCKWRDVSMQGNTFLEGKKHLHRMGNHSLMRHYMPVYIWNMRNILECFIFLFLFFVLHTKTQVAQSDPCVQITAGRSIWLYAIALKNYKWNIMHGIIMEG